jgi:hypothetical protein
MLIKRSARRFLSFTAIVGLISLLSGGKPAGAADGWFTQPPAPCDVRLLVELTPDVPDPRDVGFLGSLLSDHVSYELSLRRERSDSAIVVELTGPGPDYRCQNVIETIRRDGRVLSVHVIGGAS